jgi:hypothetical protein
MSKIARLLTVIALTAVVYAGPVAACICPEAANMAAMPCCPEQPTHPDVVQTGAPPDVAVVCAPAPGNALFVASIELPEPVAVAFAAQFETPGLDPPRSTPPTSTPAFSSGPPLYLTTLRLRI